MRSLYLTMIPWTEVRRDRARRSSPENWFLLITRVTKRGKELHTEREEVGGGNKYLTQSYYHDD